MVYSGIGLIVYIGTLVLQVTFVYIPYILTLGQTENEHSNFYVIVSSHTISCIASFLDY